MKDFIKFALKAGVALFVIGVGAKLGTDAVEHLQNMQDQKKMNNDGQ